MEEEIQKEDVNHKCGLFIPLPSRAASKSEALRLFLFEIAAILFRSTKFSSSANIRSSVRLFHSSDLMRIVLRSQHRRKTGKSPLFRTALGCFHSASFQIYSTSFDYVSVAILPRAIIALAVGGIELTQYSASEAVVVHFCR